MNAIRVNDETEFERLRDRIDLEASGGADHWRLLRGLDQAFAEYYLEINESWTFWHLTTIAHRDAVLSHLCRLYDKTGGALSLGRFLLTVRAKREYFSDAAFRERLKDNPHVDGLATDRQIDESELAKEIESVSDSDPLVSRLHDLRNTVLSHRDADSVMKDKRQASLQSLPPEDIEALLSRARGITSKYSLLYRASLYGGLTGEDDYKHLFDLLRDARTSREAKIEEEVKAAATGGS
jgi:hypothetical protein